MRLILCLLAAEIGCSSIAWSQDRPPLADQMFCAYIEDFVPQIARNRIREVPFLRLNEFDYFDGPRSQFLKRTAHEIYSWQPDALRSALGSLAQPYIKECSDAFEKD